MTTETAPAPKKMTPAQQAQAQALERMEAIAQRTEAAARAMQEATARNESALQAIIGLARLLDSVSSRLPAEARPEPRPQTPARVGTTGGPIADHQAEPDRPADDPSDMPRTGRHLYAWAREHNLVTAVEEIGQGRRYPRRIVDWSPAQVSTAYCDLFEIEQEEEDELRDEPEPREYPAPTSSYGRYGPEIRRQPANH